MALALGMIELTALEGSAVVGRGKVLPHFGQCQIVELGQKFAAALSNQHCQFRVVIGEEQEWRAGREFLALEEHRRSGTEQHESCHRPVDPGSGELVRSQTATRVCNLI